MALFNIENGGLLEVVREQPFKLEKEIQSLTETNLKLIFGLEFVKSEFSLNSFRIDTLAFDEDAGTFIVIELGLSLWRLQSKNCWVVELLDQIIRKLAMLNLIDGSC